MATTTATATATAVVSPRIPRIAAQGVAGGLALMAVFTSMWGWWAFAGLVPAVGVTVALIYSALSAIFVAEAVRLLVAARALRAHVPDGADLPDNGGSRRSGSISQPRQNSGMWFGIIFGAEGLVIFVVCAVLGANGGTNYVNPAIAMIVGVHFIPLAWVFRRTVDFYVAGWFICAAGAGILTIASAAMPVALVWTLVSIAAAAGTSFYGFYMIGVKRAILTAA
jgi:hypothetical protein